MLDWFRDHPNAGDKDVYIADTKLDWCPRVCTLLTSGPSILANTSNKADRWSISTLDAVQCGSKVKVLPDGPEPMILFMEKK